MSSTPIMSDVDHSTDRLISDVHINVTRRKRRNNVFTLKIALWTTILLSMMLAGTAFMMLIFSNYSVVPFIEDYEDDNDADFISTNNLLVNSVRVIATHRAAKIIVTRPKQPSMELDLSFQNSHNYKSRRRRDNFEDGPPESCEGKSSDALECISWPSQGARLILDEIFIDQRAKCYNVTMLALNYDSTISACFQIHNRQLYGGPVVGEQHWPSQTNQPLQNVIYLTGYDGIRGVAERFWITSKGEAIYVPPDVPLFVSQNAEMLCLESRVAAPYHRTNASSVSLSTVMCTAENTRSVFLAASKALLGTPSSPPDPLMLKYPIWSTWSRYKRDINTNKVIKFARDIKRYGFPNSQLEIDDRWQVCYGYSDFDNKTFSNANETVKTLQQLGFRVTLWMHPFENNNCYSYLVACGLQLLVYNPVDNATDTIQWWDGRAAGLIDFTKPLAASWFKGRVEYLKKHYNINGFKFDAGEASYVPSLAMLYGPEELQPASLSTAYASIVAEVNPGMAEMRSLFMAQRFPLIVRMDDKDSVWGYNNGLKSLIPTLLTLNIVGYSTIMPDMIGGNGYGNLPDKELFIRWLQASIFMPVLQFSYAPWDYDNETINIAKKYVNLHSRYHELFTKLATRKIEDSSPINRPIWWIAPNDSVALSIDSEYMLGDRLLVAPVLEKGATHRDIYLPTGTWREGLRPKERLYHGPIWIRNHPAPLDHLPFFELVNKNSIDISNVLLA